MALKNDHYTYRVGQRMTMNMLAYVQNFKV